MKTVLIADDDYANRALPGLLLDKTKYEVHEASNGTEVLKLIELYPVDFLLLDISLPHISGIDICRIIKAERNHQHIKIIAYTAHSMEWEIQKIMQAGFDQILVKPITKEKLLRALQGSNE